jgi:hypothetical protein
MAGLYSMSVIAEFLGQKPENMSDRVELDGMPVIDVPGGTKPIRKVALLPFCDWLASRSQNAALTPEQLEQELERCEESVLRKHQAKAERAKAKKETSTQKAA